MNYTLSILPTKHKQSIKIPVIEIDSKSYKNDKHKFIFHIYSARSLEIMIDNNSINVAIIYNQILNDDIMNNLRIMIMQKLIPYHIITKLKNSLQPKNIKINIKDTDNFFSNKIKSIILSIYEEHGFQITSKD